MNDGKITGQYWPAIHDKDTAGNLPENLGEEKDSNDLSSWLD